MSVSCPLQLQHQYLVPVVSSCSNHHSTSCFESGRGVTQVSRRTNCLASASRTWHGPAHDCLGIAVCRAVSRGGRMCVQPALIAGGLEPRCRQHRGRLSLAEGNLFTLWAEINHPFEGKRERRTYYDRQAREMKRPFF